MLDDGTLVLDVVEPPKFITGRHVAAVFEKLGYDSSAGQKVFTLLVEALNRIKYDSNERDRAYTVDDENDPMVVRYSQANNTVPSAGSGLYRIPEGREKHSSSNAPAPNAALAAAFDDEEPAPRGGGASATPSKSKKVRKLLILNAACLTSFHTAGCGSSSSGFLWQGGLQLSHDLQHQ